MSRATLLAGLLLAVAPGPAQADNPPAAAPTYVGSETCATCHADLAEAYEKTPHAVPLAAATRPESQRGCEACHGPGSAHAEAGGGKGVGGLQTFAPTRSARERSAVCLACHGGEERRFDFQRSEHAASAVACTDCHDPHRAGSAHLLKADPPQLCYGCHLETRAKFALPEHHQVDEGVLGCLDCHRAHGGPNPVALRGVNNRTCFRCHGDLEGPFVFEHEAVLAEGCQRCHDPHGSVNRHLLIRQQVAQLCYECHTVTPASHVQPSFRDCTRCHVAIHGSNVDPRFLEQ
jgi:DmsE family decaheme c-type cytochrome